MKSPPCLSLGLLLAFPACGYTFGSGLPEQGVHTVCLEVVGNDTWRQRFEAELSAALSRELYASTDLLPADHATADAILQVSLTSERERLLVPGGRNDPVREGAQEAAVHLRLLSHRTGRVLLELDLLDRAEFRGPIGEDLRSARAELVRDLARKIALALAAGF